MRKGPSSTLRQVLTEGILPFFELLLILGICMGLFMPFIMYGKGDYICALHQEGGEMASPTLMRFIYLLISLFLGSVTAVLAERLCRTDTPRNMILSYFAAVFSGTFLWQAIGECSWHFGASYFCEDLGEEISVFFPRIECLSSLFLLIGITVIIRYFRSKRAFSWGSWCVINIFMANWAGHFLMIGPYPFVAEYFSQPEWFRLVGLGGGSLISAYALFYMTFLSRSIRGRLTGSMIAYCGIGMIVSGILPV